MDKNSQTEQVEIIKNQIDQALKEIEKIKNQTSTIRNAADLEQFKKLYLRQQINWPGC